MRHGQAEHTVGEDTGGLRQPGLEAVHVEGDQFVHVIRGELTKSKEIGGEARISLTKA